MHPISSRAGGCRVECFTQNGVEYAIVQNECLLVRICLTRGGDILELRYKKADMDILWHCVDAGDSRAQLASAAQPQGNFFTGYPGGWQEILPGGGPYENHGAKIGIHGEAALLPWTGDIVQDDAACVKIRLRCTLRTVPFHIEKTIEIRAGAAKLFFHETLSNSASHSISFMWGQHPAFGAPFIEEGTKLYMDAEEVLACGRDYSETSLYRGNSLHRWPFCTTADGERVDMHVLAAEDFARTELFHVTRLGSAWYALINEKRGFGFGFAWDGETFPHVWVWHGFAGSTGYPFWGKAHTMAVEFWNAYPNSFTAAEKNGSLKSIGGRSQVETDYVFAFFDGAGEVTGIRPDGEVARRNHAGRESAGMQMALA